MSRLSSVSASARLPWSFPRPFQCLRGVRKETFAQHRTLMKIRLYQCLVPKARFTVRQGRRIKRKRKRTQRVASLHRESSSGHEAGKGQAIGSMERHDGKYGEMETKSRPEAEWH